MKHGWWSIRAPSKFQGKVIFLGRDIGHRNLRLTEHKLRHMHHVYIDNFSVEVFEKTISRTDVINHSFERKFNGVCFRLC